MLNIDFDALFRDLEYNPYVVRTVGIVLILLCPIILPILLVYVLQKEICSYFKEYFETAIDFIKTEK